MRGLAAGLVLSWAAPALAQAPAAVAGFAAPAPAAPAPAAPAPAAPAPAAPAPGAPAPAAPGAAPAGPSAPDSWVPRGAAELILLDKLRAQPVTLTVKVGDSATFGSLTIAVKGCDVRPPDLPQNATAFLDITDSRGSAPEFRGWVLSNTPAVSQYEHPVYDLRLAACR